MSKYLSIERVVAFILGPIVIAGSGWLSGAAAKYGIHLSSAGIATAVGTGAAGAFGLVYRWLGGQAEWRKLTRAATTLYTSSVGEVAHLTNTSPGTVSYTISDAVKKAEQAGEKQAAEIASDIPGWPATPPAPSTPVPVPVAAIVPAAPVTSIPAPPVQ